MQTNLFYLERYRNNRSVTVIFLNNTYKHSGREFLGPSDSLESLPEYMTLKITLKIETTKDMSNTENFHWDYKGLTLLNNNSR